METKNVIAAIALSSAVIVLYSLFFIPDQTTTNQNLVENKKIEKNKPISQTGSVDDNCLIAIATYESPKQKIIGYM